ncbi:MAG: PilN domain-containing protein [Telluria sp.]
MKPVRIDFAAPGLARTLYRTPAAAWMLAVFALALCLAAAAVFADLAAREREHQQALAAVRARSNVQVAAPVVAVRPPVSAAQANAVNATVLQLNLPWRALQDAVASATPAGIALLALEPDARKRSLKISAEARGSDEMIDYVARLKREEMFADVVLTHHEISEADPNRPIRFELEAAWSAQ